MNLAVGSSGLTKQFGRQVVVDHIDLQVPSGAVYGFLGPNGSGKTTTLRMLLGLISATAGCSTVLGHPMPDGVAAALPRWVRWSRARVPPLPVGPGEPGAH